MWRPLRFQEQKVAEGGMVGGVREVVVVVVSGEEWVGVVIMTVVFFLDH
jgi:hypothetical protein